MFSLIDRVWTDKASGYESLARDAAALLHGEQDLVANAANLASLIWHTVPDLNWAGFYFMKEGELVLGPFQGKPACVRIAVGKGVCGTAAARRTSVLVEDVDAFPGHIACDGASRSELVVPIIDYDELVGVLDLDSPHRSRFDEQDRAGFERLVSILVSAI